MKTYTKSDGTRLVIGANPIHLDHLTNGIKTGPAGGSKRAKIRRARHADRLSLRRGED